MSEKMPGVTFEHKPVHEEEAEVESHEELARVEQLIKASIESGEALAPDTLKAIAERVGVAREALIAFKQEARIDHLTQLINRRGFEEALGTTFAEEQRFSRRNHEAPPVTLIHLDLDKFKSINDTFGHDAGDLYLKTVAEKLRDLIHRQSDKIARLGGDEFAIILFDTDEKGAAEVVAKISEAVKEASNEARAKLAETRELTEEQGHVTASIGYDLLNLDSHKTPQDLVRSADYAAYVVKSYGRDAGLSAKEAREHDDQDTGGEIRKRFLEGAPIARGK